MNGNSTIKENISSPKKQTTKINISDKNLEQVSIILPSSEKKENPNSNSLYNSESNIAQININNSNEKSNNMSNEEINNMEFSPSMDRLVTDIIVPSEEMIMKKRLKLLI